MLERVVVLPLSIPLRLPAVAVFPALLAAVVVIALPTVTVVPFTGAMVLRLVLRLRSLPVSFGIGWRQGLFHGIPLRTV